MMKLFELSSEELRLSLVLTEEVEKIEVGRGLAEDSWLDTECVVRSVEVDPRHLWSLYIASQLGCSHSLSILTTEAEASLQTRTDGVRVSVIDSAGHKTSNTVVTVPVQLEAASEGCSKSLSISHLGCKA